ncbi:FAD-dependent oxidoreductase [Phaeobacter gallaeciensis]|uniref:FAD-dependent oxidoreductase n=2 Tax=Roseobacteraceae TaxID=2854170 RepID=A0A366XD39_9RHOB|nr:MULTISPECIES: FAD-binding oxidoreductase [Roseobacteraceae]MBT3140490.1 FAD-binding oxidoreductase [Falsiruegeria litorea]MBT8169685.1 FAD-binding oxidoreductase [Falsiruegeria litorea]RBW62218.1 FAD-dependent oxidoreductase [Phaeobacter gallaeciensis]
MNADVMIIGGGIQGCSTAYHLALQGISVIVIEKDYIARHASGVNAGGVRLLGRDMAEIPMAKASMEMWQTLDETLKFETGFRRRTLVNVAADGADIAMLQSRQTVMQKAGYFHEHHLDQSQLREVLPHVHSSCVGGVTSELDGYALAYQATMAFRQAAMQYGARFVEGEELSLLRHVGPVWIGRTQTTTYEAGVVINCAGAWGDKVAMRIGDYVPLSFAAPMLMITARLPHFAKPVVGAVSRQLSFKQFENGTVLIGGGAKGFADRDQNTTRLDYSKLASAAKTAIEFFPIMASASINRMWAGIEGYMPDNLPVIGPAVNAQNAFHAFGFSAHGFQLGPIVGKVLADLVLNGKTDFDLKAFRIDRYERKVL